MSLRSGLPIAVVALVCLGAPAQARAGGLVAGYGFDEGSGDVAGDASGHGNGGAITGATWTAGRFGGALEFDGTGALVTVGDSASLGLTAGMTLEAWVYPTRSGGIWRDVIYKGPDDAFYLEGSSPAGAPAIGGTFSSQPLYGTAALAPDEWSHLAATYDGTTLRLHVNGVEVANRAVSGPIQPSSGALTLGGDPVFGQFWAGRIDEVRIYDRALSAAEIQADMTTPVGAAPPDPTPPAVSITSPGAGSTVSHVIRITADASDDVDVVAVEFFLDGASLGADVTGPYSIDWNSTTAADGPHTLTAEARDAGGNRTLSAPVAVTTLNPAFADELVVPGIASATTIAFLPDGRMLVGELTERIWVVQPGASQADPVPFLELDASQTSGEQGLMDIAIDPDFGGNGRLYVFYTHGAPGGVNHNRVSRFTAAGNGTVPGSELVVWEDDGVARTEHHGGALAFGPEGKLYITYGEQFVSDDSQRLDSYRGKVLRIDPDGSIPADNPFFDGPGPNRDEVWALGLRNPFRMSFDVVSGRMLIGDVGGNDASTAMEEVDLLIRGANYGWPLCEGHCAVTGTTDPIFSYPHLGRDACVTGGFIYRGSLFPGEYRGSYFFGDYVQNTIKRLTFDAAGNVQGVMDFWPPGGGPDGPEVGDPVKLVEGPDGSLYYVDIGFNDEHVPNPAAIRRIRYVIGDRPPSAQAAAAPTSGLAPLEVSFSSAGSVDPEGAALSYRWTFGDGGSSTEANPTHTYLATGVHIARLTVSDGANAALSNDVSITVGTPPRAEVLTPADGLLFRAGDLIAYSGSGTGSSGDPLPPSAFSWTIAFHHEGHVHPAGGPIAGTRTGTFPIPTSGHDFIGHTSYEITLAVTDPAGLRGTASVTIFPEKVNLSFDTSPAGLGIEVDGIRKAAPFVLDDLIGFQHTVEAPSQSLGAVGYQFAAWSDGGAQSHPIVVPAADAAYVASFGPLDSPRFKRGDANGDGVLDISDPIALIFSLFLGAPQRVPCKKSADIDDGGSLDISDVVSLLDFIFLGGSAPARPYPDCGIDPTSDDLSCDPFLPCR